MNAAKLLESIFRGSYMRRHGDSIHISDGGIKDVTICNHREIRIKDKLPPENPDQETPKYIFSLNHAPDRVWRNIYNQEKTNLTGTSKDALGFSHIEHRALSISAKPSEIQKSISEHKNLINRTNEKYLPTVEAILKLLASQEAEREKRTNEALERENETKKAFDDLEI